jgi:hypothetical protein
VVNLRSGLRIARIDGLTHRIGSILKNLRVGVMVEVIQT